MTVVCQALEAPRSSVYVCQQHVSSNVDSKRRCHTTNSDHVYLRYPNLVAGLAITQPDAIWVADITMTLMDPYALVGRTA